MTWTAVEAALHAWVVAGSGLAAGSVIHARQKGPRPAAPYIIIARQSITPIGQPARVTRAAAAPTPGAEIVIAAVNHDVVTLKFDAFAGAGGTPLGETSPGALLASVRAVAGLPGRTDALHAAGISISTFEPILELDGQFGGILEPRASMVVRCFLSSEVVETATTIESIEITNEVNGDIFIVSA